MRRSTRRWRRRPRRHRSLWSCWPRICPGVSLVPSPCAPRRKRQSFDKLRANGLEVLAMDRTSPLDQPRWLLWAAVALAAGVLLLVIVGAAIDRGHQFRIDRA